MYELSRKKGQVLKVLEKKTDIIIVEVKISEEEIAKAINYPALTGEINPGDWVILNTTAIELGLGTGGYHFVSCNLSKINQDKMLNDKPGHIMKLRYTPFQLRTLSVEEEASPYHDLIKNFTSLAGQPVVIIPLHSLLAPLVIIFKFFYPEKRVVYIMTEGGSLALKFSQLVRDLSNLGLIDKTITVGQAFGGDLEVVNIFTGLAAARGIAKGDLIVVGMGPGISGTGTKFGFSGVENCFINYAVQVLGGKSIIVPRVSFADKRQRHYGLSHHSITLLKDLINNRVDVVFPWHDLLINQLKEYGLFEKHTFFFYPIEEIRQILSESNFEFFSMGRGLQDDPLFFITAGLAVYRLRDLLN